MFSYDHVPNQAQAAGSGSPDGQLSKSRLWTEAMPEGLKSQVWIWTLDSGLSSALRLWIGLLRICMGS
eukprot:scaffold657674_cov80-Prasinocladus_malaysianus.AAC.1